MRPVQVLRQTGVADCGTVALAMILDHHGVSSPLPTARQAIGSAEEGVTAQCLLQAARRSGLDAAGFCLTLDELGVLPLPAILHWRRGHFVVLEELSGSGLTIVDPASGRSRIAHGEAAAEFSGIALAFESFAAAAPAPTSNREGAHPSNAGQTSVLTFAPAFAHALSIAQCARQLACYGGRELAGLGLVLMLKLAAFVLLLRLAAVGIFEWSGSGVSMSGIVVQGALMTCVLGTLRVWQVRIDERVRARLGQSLAERFAAALRASTPAYTLTRASRQLEYVAADIDPLLNRAMPQLGALLTLIPALVLPFIVVGFSVGVGIVLVAAAVAYISLVAAHGATRRAGARARRSSLQYAREWLRAITHRPEDLHAAGALSSAVVEWAQRRSHAEASAGRAWWSMLIPGPRPSMGLTLGLCWFGIATQARGWADADVLFVQGLALLGVLQLARGLAAFMQLVEWMPALGRLESLEREQSVVAADVVEPIGLPEHQTVASPLLTLRGIECTAPRSTTLLLSGVAVDISLGDRLSIVGATGSGKTMLARLLMGMAIPAKGRVMADGQDVHLLPADLRRELVTGAFADAELLDGTIEMNLRLSNPSASERELLSACATVGLAPWIESLPLGLATPLSRSGAAFAQHRRTLLCLARVLVRPSAVLVVDGVLDALDSTRFAAVAAALPAHSQAVVLLTTRADVVLPEYRQLDLLRGQLRGARITDDVGPLAIT